MCFYGKTAFFIWCDIILAADITARIMKMIQAQKV